MARYLSERGPAAAVRGSLPFCPVEMKLDAPEDGEFHYGADSSAAL
jgi:hypothetical protein